MYSTLINVLLVVSAAIQTSGLIFTKPDSWTARAPASSMRVAEFVVPKAAGAPEAGELIVYFFGGGGGSVQANLQRWTGQFQSATEPVMRSLTVNSLKVTTIDVSGTYVAEVRPGSTERHNKPGFRMRAAVVETPKGP